ncbi:MAG: hypothetical protein GY756_00595 [bacterium]|nr:hypothetical protein [bacterium]
MRVFNKKIILLYLLYLLYLLFSAFSLSAKSDVTPKKQNDMNSIIQFDSKLIKLQAFTPPKSLMINGTIESIQKETLKFRNLGKIKSILDASTHIKGQIYNSNGKIVEYGTLIAQQYIAMDKANYELAKLALNRATIQLKKSKLDLLRNKKLLDKHVISQKIYEVAEVEYLNDKSNLQDAYQNLAKTQFLLNSNYMYSSFDAVISKIYQSPEVWYEGFNDTATIQMMNPIAIKIPIQYISDVNHLNGKPVIYSPNSQRLIKDWICEYNQFVENKYYHFFIVKNEKISFYNNLPKEYADIPTFGYATKLIKFDNNSDHLAVPLDAIQTIDGKEYIWLLTANKTKDKKNLINYRTYIANKVPINTNDRIRSIGIYKIIEIKKTNALKENDTIMWDTPPKGLKDNEMVLLDFKRWKLTPGDQVKVLVQLVPMKTGFYVPINSITLNDNDETFVTLKNGEMVKVKIEGSFANLKLISGDKIKEGVIIRQTPNEIQAILKNYYNKVLVK